LDHREAIVADGAAVPQAINRPAITACIILAVVMQALDTTIANVALPYMQGSVSASADQINWVLTSYIVAAAIMTPPSGFLANRFGRKRVLMVAIAGFVAASVLCGIAQSLLEIVAFRLLQGLFGAALVPIAQSILLDIYTPEERGSAMALFGISVMVGPVLGPVIGGYLTDQFSWRWVFYINVPIGALAFMGISIFMKETKIYGGQNRLARIWQPQRCHRRDAGVSGSRRAT
jgi:DHA2 family multidrug resistance protein